MERRNRDRLAMTALCRVAPCENRRRAVWKQIENISGAGMLLVWSAGEPEVAPPSPGDRFTVELRLPSHPVFGQRALQFQSKVVRVFRRANGRMMAALESTHSRFKFIRQAPWAESKGPVVVQ